MSFQNQKLEPGVSDRSEEPYIVEQDDRWTAVDAFQFPHLNPKSSPYHNAINHAFSNSIEKSLEDISVAPSQGKFLSVQCQIIGAKHVLEIDTLGAYSTIWMASASPEIKVVTLEVDADIAEIARENIRFAGLEDRIEVVVGAALDLLPRLADEIKQGERAIFPLSMPTRPRGVVYIDNMVRKGLLADEERAKTDANVRGIRKAVEGIGKDTRADAVILQTVGEKNYDGFLMAIVK
ncbi:MAG: hypothetical protein Q9209_005291 [Squamulea sp. 1 TL-2023]